MLVLKSRVVLNSYTDPYSSSLSPVLESLLCPRYFPGLVVVDYRVCGGQPPPPPTPRVVAALGPSADIVPGLDPIQSQPVT